METGKRTKSKSRVSLKRNKVTTQHRTTVEVKNPKRNLEKLKIKKQKTKINGKTVSRGEKIKVKRRIK